jgi:hypothetical protein
MMERVGRGGGRAVEREEKGGRISEEEKEGKRERSPHSTGRVLLEPLLCSSWVSSGSEWDEADASLSSS